MAFEIKNPFPLFADIDGSPLEDGFLYIGTVGLDPITNQVDVYWDKDLTDPATQPISVKSGSPVKDGIPRRIYTASEYSFVAQNKREENIYSSVDPFLDASVSAENVAITDAGGYYTSDNVEDALQEVGADLADLESTKLDITAPTVDAEVKTMKVNSTTETAADAGAGTIKDNPSNQRPAYSDGTTWYDLLLDTGAVTSTTYIFLVDSTSADVSMVASNTWVVGDGFAGPNYPSTSNSVLNNGDIVCFKNIGSGGNIVDTLPDSFVLLDGQGANYIYYDGTYFNMAEQPPVVRAEYRGSNTVVGTNNIIYGSSPDSFSEDTHDAYNDTTGVYTVKVPGIYDYSFDIFSSVAGEAAVYIDSVEHRRREIGSSGERVQISGSVRCSIGQEISIQPLGSTAAVDNTAVSKMIIERKGS